MISKAKKDIKDKFKSFQGYLYHNGPYNIIVDGANVAYYGQNFVEGKFTIGYKN